MRWSHFYPAIAVEWKRVIVVLSGWWRVAGAEGSRGESPLGRAALRSAGTVVLRMTILTGLPDEYSAQLTRGRHRVAAHRFPPRSRFCHLSDSHYAPPCPRCHRA